MGIKATAFQNKVRYGRSFTCCTDLGKIRATWPEPAILPQYSECGSPPQLLKINFFFSTPDCKYHQFLNINASGLLQVLVKY